MNTNDNQPRWIYRLTPTCHPLFYLGLILLLGLALRWYDLGAESFWIDEIFTVHLVQQDFQSLIQQLLSEGRLIRHSLYFTLLHAWVSPLEINEVTIRSISVLFGVLAIGMMYLVGAQLFGKTTGLISSFFLAISGFQILHAQSARFYSLFVFLTLCSFFFYILAIQKREPHFFYANLLVNCLLFYTHSFAIFIFLAEGLHYLFSLKLHKNTFIHWVVSQVVLLVALVPSLLPFLKTGTLSTSISDSIAWIEKPNGKDLVRTIYAYLFPQNYQHSWLFIGGSFAVAGILFCLILWGFHSRRRRGSWLDISHEFSRSTHDLAQAKNELLLTGFWLVCPILLPFGYSLFFTPIYQNRYTICAAPAFYLLIAVIITTYRRIVPEFCWLLTLLVVIAPGLADYYASPVNEQWREAASFVTQNEKPGDILIFAPDEEGYQHKSFDWYYPGSLTACGIPSSTQGNPKIYDRVETCRDGHPRFWVIIRGTPAVAGRFKSFFLQSNLSEYRMMMDQQYTGVSVNLFESTK